MEIERKFTIKSLPDLDKYDKSMIAQAYLNRDPVVRIRRQDDEYYITYKGKGLLAREEYNLVLTKEAFDHLLPKADGNVITKTRYPIPLENPRFKEGYTAPKDLSLTIELDVFEGDLAPLIMAEVEFPDTECADAYLMEDWFLEDVTADRRYHNVNMVYGDKDNN